jgi:eukaryotic-like serine/threonine-protein kinase
MDDELIGGRYRLDRPLGAGPMAEVWLAHDVELERPVALKLLAPTADDERFGREARAAAALSHVNVVRLYDYGREGDRPFMAFEYLAGGTLEDRLAGDARLPDEQSRAVAAELAAGLAHAHREGLVHRDIKPANVLFDDDGHAKLADFGIARLSAADSFTEAGTIMGTAAYISPEQASGDPAGTASDVYSFGAVLYRMLTGRLPFEAETPVGLMNLHRYAEPDPIEAIRPDAPHELAALAGRALAKDPRDRPPDGAALVAALDGAATPPERPVDTAASAPTALMRPPRRPRAGLRLAILLAVAGVLVAGGIALAMLSTGSDGTGLSPAKGATTRSGSSRSGTTTGPSSSQSTRSTTGSTTGSTTRPRTRSTTTVPPVPGYTTVPTTTVPTTTFGTTATTTPTVTT